MGFFQSVNPFKKRADALPTAFTAEQLQSMAVMEAVGQIMICDSWDLAIATFSRYADDLKHPDVLPIIEALKASLKDDAYSLALVEQKAKLIAILRENGIRGILTHQPVTLKEAPSFFHMFARMGKMRSYEEAASSGKEMIEIMSRR